LDRSGELTSAVVEERSREDDETIGVVLAEG
jgi:hypothetical protein